jgi:hypothetical protein
MSILTDRELEFLAGLHTGWSRLYWNELAILLPVQPGDAAGACLPLRLAEEVDGLGSAVARLSTAGGGSLSTGACGDTPTPGPPKRERERGGASCCCLIIT